MGMKNITHYVITVGSIVTCLLNKIVFYSSVESLRRCMDRSFPEYVDVMVRLLDENCQNLKED